jgi:hypothetical protein
MPSVAVVCRRSSAAVQKTRNRHRRPARRQVDRLLGCEEAHARLFFCQGSARKDVAKWTSINGHPFEESPTALLAAMPDFDAVVQFEFEGFCCV